MKPLYWTRILISLQPAQQLLQDSADLEYYLNRFEFLNYFDRFYCRVNLWEKLEEVAPESWDEFTELFSRQVVTAKPLKQKPENKRAKQQAIKSI